MKFIEVKNIPATKDFGNAGKARANVEAFLATHFAAAEVDFSEDYQTPAKCYASLKSAVKRHGLPVRVYSRSGHVYIARAEKE